MTGATLDRRFRRRWLGYEPADVEAALRAADARVAELDRALAAQTQELERLRAEVGRAYTAEAGIARALVVAEQVGATLKDQAAAEAEGFGVTCDVKRGQEVDIVFVKVGGGAMNGHANGHAS